MLVIVICTSQPPWADSICKDTKKWGYYKEKGRKNQKKHSAVTWLHGYSCNRNHLFTEIIGLIEKMEGKRIAYKHNPIARKIILLPITEV